MVMFKEGYLRKHDYENWQTMTSKYHGIENSSKKLVEINKTFLGNYQCFYAWVRLSAFRT